MNELGLFAGHGGGLLGSKLLGWRTVCACEINEYSRNLLLQRQHDGIFEHFPIWNDVRSFDGKQWRGLVDILTAGFPCQPHSTSGKRRGATDERNLWPDTIRIINECNPKWVLLENVPGLLSSKDANGNLYFGTILEDLSESGFDARWEVLSASALGAPHQRKRLWILARNNKLPPDTTGIGCYSNQMHQGIKHHKYDAWASNETCWTDENTGRIYPDYPKCLRMDDGITNSLVERISAIGNGQIPAMVVYAWETLSGEFNYI